jgi:hypothetical protein
MTETTSFQAGAGLHAAAETGKELRIANLSGLEDETGPFGLRW